MNRSFNSSFGPLPRLPVAAAALIVSCLLAGAPAIAAPGGMPTPAHQPSGGGGMGMARGAHSEGPAVARPGMTQQTPGGLVPPPSRNVGSGNGGNGQQGSNWRGGHGYDGRGHNGYGNGYGYRGSGYSVRHLPGQPEVVVRNGSRYWYSGGGWYRYSGGSYWYCGAPVGVIVSTLPAYATFVSFGIGGGYYYANNAYYEPLASGGYQVVDPPSQSVADAAPASSSKLFVYPRQGQSASTQESDEYDCHRWAVERSSYDPTLGATGQSSGSAALRTDYDRAYTACLEGRGYTVR